MPPFLHLPKSEQHEDNEASRRCTHDAPRPVGAGLLVGGEGIEPHAHRELVYSQSRDHPALLTPPGVLYI